MALAGTQAMIPKARGMYAKRVTHAEYQEMIRRRTVPEVAALLRRHPAFAGSLASLNVDPHRGQIEELLDRDVFHKYEALLRYETDDGSFSLFYYEECTLREILRALHLRSIGMARAYNRQVPSYLVGKVPMDMFELANAPDMPGVLHAIRHTRFARPLAAYLEQDPALRDYPLMEAALLRAYYEWLFASIDENFSGRERENVRRLFLDVVEGHNLELLLRVKTYFGRVYTPAQIDRLLMPYAGRVPKSQLRRLAEAPSTEAFLALLQALPMIRDDIPAEPESFEATMGRSLYNRARRVLHLSSSPYAALAAFLVLTKLQKDNIINVIEGVRYGMPPERISSLLRQ